MELLHRYINDKHIIVLKKDNGDEMQMSFEGADFYFTMYNYHDDNEFVIEEENELYVYFKKIFTEIRINDKPYDRLLNNNQFVWIGEDYGEYENANRLTITEQDDCYIIHFYNNPNKIFANAKICPICFCLSGSKNQKIANSFAIMFNNIISKKQKVLCLSK